MWSQRQACGEVMGGVSSRKITTCDLQEPSSMVPESHMSCDANGPFSNLFTGLLASSERRMQQAEETQRLPSQTSILTEKLSFKKENVSRLTY